MKDIAENNAGYAMTDVELEGVAGGNIDWYYRKDQMPLDPEDPNSPVIDGFQFEGEDPVTGTIVHSRFMSTKAFSDFRKQHREDNFFMGSLEEDTMAAVKK